MPAQWRCLGPGEFDAGRAKQPTPAAAKYRFLAPWLLQQVAALAAEVRRRAVNLKVTT
jgi:hypothetical protein